MLTINNLFPIKPPTDEEAFADYADLQALNSVMDLNSVVKSGEWFSRSDFDNSFCKPVYIDTDRTGLKASDRHHWAARMACDSINSPSPIRNWYQKKHRETLQNRIGPKKIYCVSV